MSKPVVEANGRLYAWPTNPVIVVCMDGSEPGYESSDGGGYIERAIEAGVMPFMARMIETGTQRLADCVVPSFTNPNNISIVTGARFAAVHTDDYHGIGRCCMAQSATWSRATVSREPSASFIR